MATRTRNKGSKKEPEKAVLKAAQFIFSDGTVRIVTGEKALEFYNDCGLYHEVKGKENFYKFKTHRIW